MKKLNTFVHQWIPSLSGSRKSLMIVLHGRGDSIEGFTWMPNELALPDLNYLLLQAPDDYYEGFSWYDLPPNQQPGILRSRQLLSELFIELELQGFKANQCFLFGFSQGCLMTLEFGSRYPQKLKGYIGISGYCFNVENLLSEARPENIHEGDWLITHGTIDDVLDIETTRSQMKELMSRGFKMDYREYRKSHTIDPKLELSDIRKWIEDKL